MAALNHARQVARECARDVTYRGAAIKVIDTAGREIATVAVPEATCSGFGLTDT